MTKEFYHFLYYCWHFSDIRNPASASNVPFPNPIHAPTELPPIRPEFGVVNSSIPRLPPPPLPPFYGSASAASCEALTIPGSASAAYHNTSKFVGILYLCI